MAINVEKDAIDAVWAALEAREGFTDRVKVADRVKTEDHDSPERDAVRGVRVGGYPRVSIAITGNSTNRPGAPMGHADCDYPIEGQLTIEIRSVFDAMHDDAAMPLEAEIDASLMSSIDLGLPFVRYITTRKTRRPEISAITRGVLRLVSRQTVTMETSIMRSEFV